MPFAEVIEIGPGLQSFLSSVVTAILLIVPMILTHFNNKRNAAAAAEKVAEQADKSAKEVAAVAVQTAKVVAVSTMEAAKKVADKVAVDSAEVVARVMQNDEKTESLTSTVAELKTIVNGERDKMQAELNAAKERAERAEHELAARRGNN